MKTKAHLTKLSHKLATLVDEHELVEAFQRIFELNPSHAHDWHAVLERAWTMIDRQRERSLLVAG